MTAPAYIPEPGSPAGIAERLRAYLSIAGAGSRAGAACSGRGPAARTVPEGLVDVRLAAPALVILSAPAWSDPELRFSVRPELADRLARAAAALPDNLRLGFWEGLRPVSVQQALWEGGLGFLRASWPEASLDELEGLLDRYVARPTGKRPPHSTGSAVDVAPVDAFGRILTSAGAWGKLAVDAMASALRGAGLAGYAPEWWHWSYGDEEWALAYDCAPLPFALAPDEANAAGDGI